MFLSLPVREIGHVDIVIRRHKLKVRPIFVENVGDAKSFQRGAKVGRRFEGETGDSHVDDLIL